MSLGGNMAGLLSRNRVLSTQIGFDEQRITVRPDRLRSAQQQQLSVAAVQQRSNWLKRKLIGTISSLMTSCKARHTHCWALRSHHAFVFLDAITRL